MMAASVRINPGALNSAMHNPGGSGIAFEIEFSECVSTASPIPKRVRQRLEETPDMRAPASLEEIEFKLKEADSRRQQFQEWLANKARPKPRLSPTHSEQAENLAQRLEAKLSAAEQKRAELLAHEQTRLAKLHELRVAAKTEAQLRAEREREELGSKVESRVQQAESNRLALVEAERQRIAAVHERVAQSIQQRNTQEGRDRERIEALRATICQKIAAAEEKRAGLLEAEKSRAQACVLQARRVADAVVREREQEARKKKEKLEARLQRAKRQRAEYLMNRGGCRGSCHNHGHKHYKHGDRLCRKLTRCWRQFRGSKSTTYALAQEYAACQIGQEIVISLPFEQLASRITSPATLRAVKPLLARIESRLMLSCAGKSTVGQIEHLLKRLAHPQGQQRRRAGGGGGASAVASGLNGKKVSGSPNKGCSKVSSGSLSSPSPLPASKASSNRDNVKSEEKELERYPARVVLCAYMILGQPDAVFSGRGDLEMALAEAAAKLLPEFEALLSIILDGPSPALLPPSSAQHSDGGEQKPSPERGEQQKHENNNSHHQFTLASQQRPFSAQLAAFDEAWCTYLYQFVAWKVKDAQLLEEDLTRMACQLEISMLQKCKSGPDLSHDSQAIRKQVLEDQKLLHDRISRLTGTAGASRMEKALEDVRSKFNEAVENGTPVPSPFSSRPSSASRTPIASPSSPSPFLESPEKTSRPSLVSPSNGRGSNVARSLFASEKADVVQREPPQHAFAGAVSSIPPSPVEATRSNEKIVNDMLHDQNWPFSNATSVLAPGGSSAAVHPSLPVNELQTRIRATIETAFWDGIAEGLCQTPPQYDRVVMLVAEVRRELENIVPDNWKRALLDNMDLDLLRAVLVSGSNDFDYLRHLLDYAAGLILKLGAPVRDSGAKAAHQSLLAALSTAAAAEGGDGACDRASQKLFADALVRGLRFIFDQLQVLKQDINYTRLRALAPLIHSSAGVDYARKAFATRFNLPHHISNPANASLATELSSKLPRTAAWIAEVMESLDHEREVLESAMAVVSNSSSSLDNPGDGEHLTTTGTTTPPIPSMRTGGRLAAGKLLAPQTPLLPTGGVVGWGDEPLRPKPLVWRSNDTILRLGLLRVVAGTEPATEANVSETLILNVDRIRNCQNEFQRIVVIATALLVARQGLTGKGIVGKELDSVMHIGCARLDGLLNEPTATIPQIGAVLADIPNSTGKGSQIIQDARAYGELMTRVLVKSLSPDDAVFARVSAAVATSLRTVLLLGKGANGLGVAKLALTRIGASMLTDKVIKTAVMLEKISNVTGAVHEPWYSCLASNAP